VGKGCFIFVVVLVVVVATAVFVVVVVVVVAVSHVSPRSKMTNLLVFSPVPAQWD
jgi:hypothetical protein